MTFHKPIACIFFFLIISVSAFSQKTNGTKKNPIQWLNGITYDFKKITRDKIATAVFEFRNDGDSPVSIKAAEASCNCIVPDFSQEPVLPGDKGFIRVSYNPKHSGRQFFKTIFVFTNISKERIELHIKGEVIK